MSLVILTIFSNLLVNSQRTADESDTGALLKFPSVVDGPLYGKEWDVSPAQFGYQNYGGSITGWLILPANTSYHTECIGEELGMNEYIHWVNDNFLDDTQNIIFVIDRGDCYFVNKVELAQTLGASAVIIIDHTPENLFTMWMPDDWKDDIDIPSVLLQEKYGEILMSHIGVINWNPKDISKTTYPNVLTMNYTKATIEWGLPHDDDRVEWELWTSSNDPLAVKFKKNFKPISLILDDLNYTVFEPRMYILNGSHWGCNDNTYLPCGNQCSNNGRYCSVDPEYDLSYGISGIDVIQENLRNLCVWNYTQRQEELQHNLNESIWWDYAVMWDQYCAFDNDPNTFSENCSFTQMNIIDNTGNLVEFVKQCINISGGYDMYDNINTMLEYEVSFREKNGIYAMPMVRVNEFLIHGNIDCDILTPQDCEVFSAICAGFLNGTQPDLCNTLTSSPTPQPSEGCHIDRCGVCRFLDDPNWNSCVGCDNIVNSTKQLNPCGICLKISNPLFNTSGQDCSGVCEGSKQYDRCGNCLDLESENWDSCVGCDYKVNSTKQLNPCGICLSITFPDFDISGKDCAGICQGHSITDDCGQCLLPSNPLFNKCVGCDGIPNSNKVFDCKGICDGPNMFKCGSCLNPNNITEWNEVSCDSSNNNNDNNSASSSSNEIGFFKEISILTNGFVIASIIVVIVLILCGIQFCRMQKKQKVLENKLGQLAGSYQFMNDDPEVTNVNVKMNKNTKRRTKLGVADQEEEDDIL